MLQIGTRTLFSKIGIGQYTWVTNFHVRHATSLNNPTWKLINKLPQNPNTRGPLTDDPDFAYTDGRPTPYNVNQRKRKIKQMEYAKKAVELLKKIDICKTTYQNHVKIEEQAIEAHLGRKLKPKGTALLRTRNKKRSSQQAVEENLT